MGHIVEFDDNGNELRPQTETETPDTAPLVVAHGLLQLGSHLVGVEQGVMLAQSGTCVHPPAVSVTVAHTSAGAGEASTSWVGSLVGVFFQKQGETLMVFKYGGMGWYWWLVTTTASLFGEAIFPAMSNELTGLAAGAAKSIWDQYGTNIVLGSVAGVVGVAGSVMMWPVAAPAALAAGAGVLGNQLLDFSVETTQDVAMNVVSMAGTVAYQAGYYVMLGYWKWFRYGWEWYVEVWKVVIGESPASELLLDHNLRRMAAAFDLTFTAIQFLTGTASVRATLTFMSNDFMKRILNRHEDKTAAQKEVAKVGNNATGVVGRCRYFLQYVGLGAEEVLGALEGFSYASEEGSTPLAARRKQQLAALETAPAIPQNPLQRAVLDDVLRLLVSSGQMKQTDVDNFRETINGLHPAMVSLTRITWWNLALTAMAFVGFKVTQHMLRWRKIYCKVIWTYTMMPGIRIARRLYEKDGNDDKAAQMVLLEAHVSEVSAVLLDPSRVVGLHLAIGYIRNSQLRHGLTLLDGFCKKLALVPTVDHAVGIGVAYLRNAFSYAFDTLRAWSRPKLAVAACVGLLAAWTIAPTIASALAKETIVEILLWVTRGFFSTLSSVNLGHLQYLVWALKGVAEVMGVGVVKDMVGRLSNFLDAGDRSMREALYAIGTSAMYVVYGPPKNPALFKALEPKHALRMLPPSKDKSNFIAKIGKGAYDLVHPWTILKFIWKRGAWRMSFLLMLWRMTLSSSAALSSLSTAGKVVNLFL